MWNKKYQKELDVLKKKVSRLEAQKRQAETDEIDSIIHNGFHKGSIGSWQVVSHEIGQDPHYTQVSG